VDRSRALWLFDLLKSDPVGGAWLLQRYINHGKSGAVFEATGDSNDRVALKVFDPELIETFGYSVMDERINREKLVGGTAHESLVRVMDGGRHGIYCYIVMELIDAPTLDVVVNNVPRDRIRSLIAQVAAAAEHLESHGIVHRDIKPSNIAIAKDFSRATLLDFGVVRTDRGADITGPDQFLGTKRYAPPEFLARQEKDTVEGWRAITFYQLGGVLHDVIMRQRLFAEYDNDAQLFAAIAHETPRLNVTDVAPDLVSLAEACLVKSPEVRLQLVSWDRFRESEQDDTRITAIRTRVATRRACTAATDDGEPAPFDSRPVVADMSRQVEAAIRRIVIGNNQDFPPLRLRNVGADVLCVSFRPSRRFALAHNLAVYIRTTVLDALSQAISLEFSAIIFDALDGDQSSPAPSAVLRYRSIYNDVYSAQAVAVHLEEVLYRALDAAQSVGPDLLTGGYVEVL
jgi:serine/threonine protein kinase